MNTVSLALAHRLRNSKGSHGLASAVKQAYESTVEGKSIKVLQAIQEVSQPYPTNLVTLDAHLTELRQELFTFSDECRKDMVVRLGRDLSAIESLEIYQALGDVHDELQKKLTPAIAYLNDKAQELKYQKKWLEYRFPESVLDTHPDCVNFMMKSGFGYNLKMFGHQIQLKDGAPRFLFDGKFWSWSKIKQLVDYDSLRERVFSLSDPTKEYNYISPAGFVAQSPMPQELYPIEQLSQVDLRTLQDHAKKFWQTNEEIDPFNYKDCVLQVVTSVEGCVGQTWLSENLNAFCPNHTTLRLVDAKGNVYSFGVEVEREFERYVQNHPFHFFSTGYAKVITPDYKETRKFVERSATSIPITNERLQMILNLVRDTNKDAGMRFCMTKQNCNKFGLMVMELAGITLDTTMSIGEIVLSMMPSVERIPLIGGPLAWLRNLVKKVAEPIFAAIKKYTPKPIKRVVRFTLDVVFYIPRKIGTVFFNSLIYAFGGTIVAQNPVSHHDRDDKMDKRRTIHFSRLMSWWGDIFNDEKALCNHPIKLRAWQKRHASTVDYKRGDTPTLHIMPPAA